MRGLSFKHIKMYSFRSVPSTTAKRFGFLMKRDENVYLNSSQRILKKNVSKMKVHRQDMAVSFLPKLIFDKEMKKDGSCSCIFTF